VKKTKIVEQAACKNKEGCSSTTSCEKTRTVEEVEQKVYEVETAYSTVLDYTAPHPTDPVLFAARPTDSMLVRSIVLHDVCQPGLNDNFSTFPEDKDKRRFSPNWYHRTLPNGAKAKRSWLIYSPEKNKMFCHHCWLFSDRTSSSYSPNWTEVDIGVDNFKKGLEKIVKHEQSVMHLNATSCFMTTKYRITKDETVISQLTSEEKRE